MNWNYELATLAAAKSAIQRNPEIYAWAKSETAYNCDGCYYAKDIKRFHLNRETSIKRPFCLRLSIANALRTLADKIYPLSFPYAETMKSTYIR